MRQDLGCAFYWNVDVPGLSQEQANWLLATTYDRYGAHGSEVDPGQWLTVHLDRETVRVLRDALASASGDVANGMSEIMEQWLDAVGDDEE